MTTKKTHIEIGILMREVRDASGFGSAPFYHFNGHLVSIEDGKIRGFRSIYGPVNGGLEALDGLQVHSQGQSEPTSAARRLYAFEIEYRDVFSINAEKARKMARTLVRVSAKMDKLRDQRGYAQSYGEFVGRFAEALGKNTKIIQAKREGSSFHEGDHQFYSIGEGVNWINHVVSQWKSEPDDKAEAKRLVAGGSID